MTRVPFALLAEKYAVSGMSESFNNAVRSNGGTADLYPSNPKPSGSFGQFMGHLGGAIKSRGSFGQQVGKGIQNTGNTLMGTGRTGVGLATSAIGGVGDVAGRTVDAVAGRPTGFGASTREFANEFGYKPLQAGLTQLGAGLTDQSQADAADQLGTQTEYMRKHDALNRMRQDPNNIVPGVSNNTMATVADYSQTAGETAGMAAVGGGPTAMGGKAVAPLVRSSVTGGVNAFKNAPLLGKAMYGLGAYDGVTHAPALAERAKNVAEVPETMIENFGGEMSPKQRYLEDNPVPGQDQLLTEYRQNPQQYDQQIEQAGAQFQEHVANDPTLQAGAKALANGQPLPGEVQQQGQSQLAKLGLDPQGAMDFWNGMSGPQQFATAAGLGIGLVGLISALSGDGGIMSWLAPLLGLGTAAGGLASAGAFGDTAQNFVNDGVASVSNLISPSAKSDAGADATAAGGGGDGMLDSLMQGFVGPNMYALPDSMVSQGLQMMAQSNPEIAAKLDQAAGTGDITNKLFYAPLGSMTGETGKRLTAAGIPEDQHVRVLDIWRKLRDQG